MATSPSRFAPARPAVILALALLARSDAAAAQRVAGYDFSGAQRVIDSVMREHRIPSVAVAVAKGDRILWEGASGMADAERQAPATAQTPYSLASISKPITATGVMLLAQRGFIRLHSPVNHYLGGVRVNAREGHADDVTVERLLTHTAGLPLHYQFFYEDGGYERPLMDSTIRRYAVAVYPPGGAYQYSNLGYGLLDYVISRKSGSSYAEFMRRDVFAPLGMHRTSVGLPPNRGIIVAQRYDDENRPIPYYTFDHPGASEVYSSARDLALFGMYHLGARVRGQRAILAPETLRDMQRDVAPEGPGRTRGLGWAITTVFGARRVSHSGSMPGVSTFLALYPEDQVVVVVLLNKRVPQATSAIVNELSAVVVPRFASGRLAAPAAAPGAATVDSVQLSAMQGTWRGHLHTYTDSIPVTLTVAPGAPARLAVGGSAAIEIVGMTLMDGVLSGRSAHQLRAPDLARHPHQLIWWLRLNGDRLSGYVAAQSTTGRGYYALSSYVKLLKTSG